MLAVFRLLRALAHVMGGYWMVRREFPRLDEARKSLKVQAWSVRMLHIMGISLDVQGDVPQHGPLLLVANHISWLDILVLHASRHCRFVSKADVQHWPLIGTLAQGCGTLFVERESRRDAMRVVHHMADALRSGDMLAIFPEGTTSDGIGTLPFHANLFQAAISAHAPVQAIGLTYLDAQSGGQSHATDYIGDTSLLSSVWATVTAKPLCARVNFGPHLAAQGLDRRTLAALAREQVTALRQLTV
ncbi:MAG: 1-acyl-sn-glycerol-3-phosphate acyltransferase [Burkholderiaceae bacterium]|jgi:1-acyl-sn-glycerol-3-phosphate acyltransferase|nr:1-acyl-sn-glycerol-3-phosphate acyltransferase [Betaproteobacteria bacterium]MBP6646166.1 1-acyl-sn-glycerol-3-phosphate acyltransferase [Burkholderiaceae bacterium]